MIVVGLSGSILVFREELTALSHRGLVRSPHPDAPLAGIETVVANLHSSYPLHTVDSVQLPSLYTQNFRAFLSGASMLTAYSDRASGMVIGAIDRDSFWLTWMQQLHFYLLAGRPGLIVNGVGGVILMFLCATGMFLWWPGVRRWVRALVVDFGGNWKRLNWALHSAGGFWTLPIVFLWGLTGAYFAWPREYAAVVNMVSPVTAVAPPAFRIVPPTDRPADLNLREFIRQAEAREPGHRFSGIQFPATPATPLRVMMARGDLWNTRSTNYLYFDPYRRNYLGTWRRGVNKTLGDEIVFLMGPLHFGVYWGMAVKILWAALGLALPGLAVTGCLMYWNRSLSVLWRRLTASKDSAYLTKLAGKEDLTP